MDPQNQTASSHLKNKTGPKRKFMSNGFSGALAASFREGIPCFQPLNFSGEKARRIFLFLSEWLEWLQRFWIGPGVGQQYKKNTTNKKELNFSIFKPTKKNHSTRVVYVHLGRWGWGRGHFLRLRKPWMMKPSPCSAVRPSPKENDWQLWCETFFFLEGEDGLWNVGQQNMGGVYR